jgi:hypothetical protein
MTRYTPQWLQQGTYAASVDRRLIGALWPAAAVSGCAVTAGSGMTVNVAAGQVAVPSQNNTGSTLCSSDAVEQVTLTAAPASGSNRYDLVVCHPRGNDLDGGANNDFVFEVVTGTAAASPSPPPVPAGQAALAQIYVPGGSASVTAGNITDRRSPMYGPNTVFARVYLTANTTPTSGQPFGFNAATRDPLAMWSNTSKVFTAPYAGHYLVAGSLDTAGNAVNQWCNLAVQRNGTTVALCGWAFASLASWDIPAPYHEIVVCNQGDTIGVFYTGNISTIKGDAAGTLSFCTVQYLHP